MRLPQTCGSVLIAAAFFFSAGCRASGPSAGNSEKTARKSKFPPVRQVVCMFDHHPWINADSAGDRDPEGIRYRVFLHADHPKGVLREGTFHIEMYMLTRTAEQEVERHLVSDWHYPTSRFNTVAAKVCGEGYHVQLRWAKKEIAGHEVELITRFEDPSGYTVRGGTKRIRVPKYVS